VALSAASAFVAGDAAIVFASLMPLLSMYAFILFSSRTAGFFLAACVAISSVLAVTITFRHTTVAIVCTTFVVLASAGLLAKVRSITAQFIRTNLELSEIDSLTGVANLRALRARTANVIERGRDTAVISLDLDEFKQVNDTYSHSVGDAVLVATARAISETARIEDLVARRGGDEFFVIVDGAREEEAQVIAARMSDAIEMARIRICPDLRPSVSIAVASMVPGDDAEALLSRADLALHERKVAAHCRSGQSVHHMPGA
jgi:diguanylate cyclase (GGDEF)-like protein